MIVLTGAGGFIGSVVLGYLNKKGIDDVILFDDLPTADQYKNLINKKYISLHCTAEMPEDRGHIDCVVHLGANSNTLERDWGSLYETNVLSTRQWNQFCLTHSIPFIFASSSAVYGNGAGPMNHYAFSKSVSETEITGVILRLFNVYGPNEYHKGRMASTIYQWFNQIQDINQYKLFEGSRQLRRDLIYVEDVARIIHHFITNYKPGVYDVGTGTSVDFETIADAVAAACKKGNKNFIAMPEDLKMQYQKDTKANTLALKESGFEVDSMFPVLDGVLEYMKYLKTNYSVY